MSDGAPARSRGSRRLLIRAAVLGGPGLGPYAGRDPAAVPRVVGSLPAVVEPAAAALRSSLEAVVPAVTPPVTGGLERPAEPGAAPAGETEGRRPRA